MVLNVCVETVGSVAGGFRSGFVKYSDKTDSNFLEGIYGEQVMRECWPKLKIRLTSGANIGAIYPICWRG